MPAGQAAGLRHGVLELVDDHGVPDRGHERLVRGGERTGPGSGGPADRGLQGTVRPAGRPAFDLADGARQPPRAGPSTSGSGATPGAVDRLLAARLGRPVRRRRARRQDGRGDGRGSPSLRVCGAPTSSGLGSVESRRAVQDGRTDGEIRASSDLGGAARTPTRHLRTRDDAGRPMAELEQGSGTNLVIMGSGC